MGLGIANQPAALDSITKAAGGSKCDVCGRTVDVAQIIGTLEGPDPEMGGLASVSYICTFCLARGIQAVTGFRAVRTLKSWYLVRNAHRDIKPGNVHHWTQEEELVG